MNHATTCQFCRRPITVEIDDDYAAIGDPYKLIQKRACNECADVRVLRRVLEERISRQATTFAGMHRPTEDAKKVIRKNLVKLLENYARMIARWNRVEGMMFDEAAVDTLMEKPSQWAEVLSKLWTMFNQWQRADKEKELL